MSVPYELAGGRRDAKATATRQHNRITPRFFCSWWKTSSVILGFWTFVHWIISCAISPPFGTKPSRCFCRRQVFSLRELIFSFCPQSNLSYGLSVKRFVILQKNGSTDGEYKIQTGVGDSSLFGETILYNGKSTLGFWEPLSHCDKINGSDGSIFPPFVEKSWRIPIFSSDLCRSVDLDYHSEMEMHGIKGYRFKLARDALEDPVVNRNNRCYCKESNDMECLMDGVLDVSACKSMRII